MSEREVMDAFTAAAAEHGIVFLDPIMADGQLHRARCEGDKGKQRKGWYLLHLDGRPAGAFGHYRILGGQRGITWSADKAEPTTRAQRGELAARIKREQAEREAAEARRHAEAAALAVELWSAAKPAKDHPYLARKGIKPHGARVGAWRNRYERDGRWHELTVAGALLVPVIDAGRVVSLQGIFAEPHNGRDKDYLTGGRKRGCYYVIGDPRGAAVIVICEGFATGASIHEATGLPVIVAFDAGNLEPVALVMRSRLPAARMVIAADNDAFTAGNPGIAHARRAAEAVGGHVVWPEFDPEAEGRPTDWNDFAQRHGLEATGARFRASEEGKPATAAIVPQIPEQRVPASAKRPRREVPPPPADAIVVVAGGRAKALADADAVLGKQPNVFQRNGALVLVAKMRDAKARADSLVKRDPDSLLLHQITPDHVMNILSGERWTKFDRRSAEWVPTDFPQPYARGVVHATEWANVRPLTGIIGAPTLDQHMNLIDVPGYHAGTGLLLATATKFSRVPDRPTKDHAREALEILRYPFAEFPWVRSDSDPAGACAAESAHLAAILTAGIRHLLDTAPAIGYDAPRRGSGKSLLGDAVGTIWHGTAPSHANYAKGDDEFRKMIASCLVAGDQIILVDNVDRPVRSPELCNVLTTTRYSDRKLGYTERYVLDARAVWLINGNNLAFVGDLARRVIICRIDPEQERPETRTFRIPNLLRYVAQNRAALAPAALTVLKAFAVANPPQQATPLGSFELWSRMVREALIWLDMPDPCTTTDEANEAEPETQALAAVLAAWRDAYAGSPRTVPEVVADAIESWRDMGVERFQRPALREALAAALGSTRDIDARALGYYLRRWKGVIVNGLRLRHAGKGHGGHVRWRLEQRTDAGSWQ